MTRLSETALSGLRRSAGWDGGCGGQDGIWDGYFCFVFLFGLHAKQDRRGKRRKRGEGSSSSRQNEINPKKLKRPLN